MIEDDIVRDAFGPHPKFRAVIAEWDKQVAGYAVFFEFYSSFQGRAGLFLDDLFVRPSFASRELASPFSLMWLGSPGGKNIFACDGKCWTGTSRPSSFTRIWVLCFSTNGNQPV